MLGRRAMLGSAADVRWMKFRAPIPRPSNEILSNMVHFCREYCVRRNPNWNQRRRVGGDSVMFTIVLSAVDTPPA